MSNEINEITKFEQTFYCKKCKKEFIVIDEKYLNYNCPDCGQISVFADYKGIQLSGCPTIKKFSSN